MEGREFTTFLNIQSSSEGTRKTVQIDTAPGIDGHDTIIHIHNDGSAEPSSNLNENDGALKKHLTDSVNLYKAALRGDWKTTERILKQDPRLLKASITRGGQTILHIAAATKHIDFMEKLLENMEDKDLEVQDQNKNTAFCYAVWGEKAIAEIMLKRNRKLATIVGGGNMTPLYMAALFGRSDMAWSLYKETKDCLNKDDRASIFFTCIDTGLYGIALELLELDDSLATKRDAHNKTALHLLAETPSAFDNRIPEGWSKLLKSACFKFGFKRNIKQSATLELVKQLWENILFRGHTRAMRLINHPSQLLFDATKLGNFEFVAALLNSYPDLIHETDGDNRSMIHYAVMYRQASIYNLVREFGSIKDLVATFEDTKGNNLLHLAALLPPPERLNIVSGEALQMQLELLWFEEVKENVQPLFRKAGNNKGISPEELFSSEHKRLLRCAESWMKRTANSCMIVAALIATVVFAAAFTLPGGNNDKDGTPNEIQANSFLIFVLSDAFALLNSVIAISMFLSILLSRYTESEFLKQLPLKLMVGLTSLFLSLTAMILVFSFSFIIAYEHHGLKWAPLLISMLAIVPISLFALLKFPLLLDTFRSTYCSGTIFQPSRLVLY